jgi:hypothetical protein
MGTQQTSLDNFLLGTGTEAMRSSRKAVSDGGKGASDAADVSRATAEGEVNHARGKEPAHATGGFELHCALLELRYPGDR